MKKILALTGAFMALAIYSFAQEGGNVEFGVHAGYNFSTAASGQMTNSSYKSGVNLGVSADYFFSDRWSIKAKPSYDQKGWNDGFIDLNGTGSTTTNYHLNYITVPVMANWHFGRTRNWYLNFGPYAGFLMSAKESALSTDLKQYFKSTDFGLAFGIGVKLPVSETTKISLEYDGQSGLSDIVKSNMGSSIRNVRGAFNVGLNFMIN